MWHVSGSIRTKAEPIEQAVDHAVTECIHRGILKEFLQGQRAEVVAMSIFEYDEEEEKRKLREAEFEYGREEGHKAGLEGGNKRRSDPDAEISCCRTGNRCGKGGCR